MLSRRRVLAVGCLVLTGGAGCTEIRDVNAADGTEKTDDTPKTDTADASEFRITVTDGDESVELVTGDDVASVGDVQRSRDDDAYQMPIRLTDDGTETFAEGLESIGAFENPEAHEIRTYFDGELVHSARLGADLAAVIEEGEWDGSFLFRVSDRKTAERVKNALENE